MEVKPVQRKEGQHVRVPPVTICHATFKPHALPMMTKRPPCQMGRKVAVPHGVNTWS